ncbi:MAG: prepilin peptidase [Phycisphaerales bacterium]|nr:prepilin peptidase [Phycisphaerales bacterium]
MATQANFNQLLFQAELLEHLPSAIFVFVFGCCVGSFLNVVIYRLPRNIRLLSPPSSCPSCNHKLRFFRENIPIIGWLVIRGKCRYCKEPVSIEYPFIELLTGLLFLICYVLCYWVSMRTSFFGDIFSEWWHINGVYRTLPMFIALVTMVSGLLAMTIIDARTFTIPIQIPIVMTAVAFIAAIVQNWIPLLRTPSHQWPIPLSDWTWTAAAFGGMVGVFVSSILLRTGVFKYSFSDYEDFVKENEVIAEYPYARREVAKELILMLPIILGFIVGWMLFYEKGFPPVFIQGLGGSVLGYLVGGGLVWAIRIFGTLGFGREAMGMGDVHLLAGVGAVVGWWDPVLIFFIAPFSGLLWAALAVILEKIGKKQHEIPYGPHLAVATLLVVFLRPGINWVWSVAMPGVIQPTTEKIQENSLMGDLTNSPLQVSIQITPLTVGRGDVKQDVSLVHRCWSSDMEKGHA